MQRVRNGSDAALAVGEWIVDFEFALAAESAHHRHRDLRGHATTGALP
jgi:hypothetical protein